MKAKQVFDYSEPPVFFLFDYYNFPIDKFILGKKKLSPKWGQLWKYQEQEQAGRYQE